MFSFMHVILRYDPVIRACWISNQAVITGRHRFYRNLLPTTPLFKVRISAGGGPNFQEF
jgi:hypothetical protein